MVAQGPCCQCCEKRQTLIMLLWGDLFPVTPCLGSHLVISVLITVILLQHRSWQAFPDHSLALCCCSNIPLAFSHFSGFWSVFPWWFSRSCQITDLHSTYMEEQWVCEGTVTALWGTKWNLGLLILAHSQHCFPPPPNVLFTVQMVSAGGPWTSVCLAVYCRRLLVGQGSTQRGAFGVACEMILFSFVLALLAQTSAPSPQVAAFQAVPARAESGSAKLK